MARDISRSIFHPGESTMRLQLGERWTERLRSLPETGMGYHVIDVTLCNGKRVRNVPVFDAEQIEWLANAGRIGPDDIVDIRKSRCQDGTAFSHALDFDKPQG